jgi:hypothetical protein
MKFKFSAHMKDQDVPFISSLKRHVRKTNYVIISNFHFSQVQLFVSTLLLKYFQSKCIP